MKKRVSTIITVLLVCQIPLLILDYFWKRAIAIEYVVIIFLTGVIYLALSKYLMRNS